MNRESLFQRYQDLQRFVGWSDADAERIRAAGEILQSHFAAVIDDFYAEIAHHPNARKVITGGSEQIERLKGTLQDWLRQLFIGPYDHEFVAVRFRVGSKHVEIGLEQVYTNVAISRIRSSLVQALNDRWQSEPDQLRETVASLNKLLDLDLAVIEDAYQAEYLARQQRSERLATIGQVAAGVAHELRNPLNAVKTSVYYLTHARNVSREKTAEHLERIDRQVGVADRVITALSDFSRLPVPNLHPIRLEQTVHEVLEKNPMPETIQVTVDCSPDLPAVLADQDQLQIALGNLIRNAGDAMPDGGELRLVGRPVDDTVELDVTDTGVGISDEHIGRILEPLYTTKARGTGLGLALTSAILEKHNGGLRIQTEPGQGSTFTMWLRSAPEQ